MKKNILIYITIMFSYLIIDVAYQALIGLSLMNKIYTQAGIRDIISNAPQYPATIPLFFVMIAFVLFFAAVKPAIEKQKRSYALFRGMLVGLAAYGTTGLVLLWSIVGFPLAAFFEIVFLEGLVFSTLASGITVLIFIPKKAKTA